jgi:hypothetical protein
VYYVVGEIDPFLSWTATLDRICAPALICSDHWHGLFYLLSLSLIFSQFFPGRKPNALTMSYAHGIDNDHSIFHFDANEPLCPLGLEDSAPERQEAHISTSSHPSPVLRNYPPPSNRHFVSDSSDTMVAKGKSVALMSTTDPMAIPIAAYVEPEIDIFSMSSASAGPSSQRYEHLPPFDFQAVEAIAYYDSEAVVEDGEGMGSKGKARELPPSLPPLSFSNPDFSDGGVEWSSVVGSSSYGSSHTAVSSEQFSPIPLSATNMSMSSPISQEVPFPPSSSAPRRRTASNASRRSLSLPRMKVKFAGVKGSSGTLARKLLFRKTPPSSPRRHAFDIDGTTNSSALLSDMGYITAGNCFNPWCRSPPATPFVETSSVWGIVDSRPTTQDAYGSSVLPLRTKGRSYSSPLPLPSASIFDILPLESIDIFEQQQELPSYFDEYLPRELKLLVFAELLVLHEAEFNKRTVDCKWTTLKAASSRHKWVGRDKGLRELFKLSRVCSLFSLIECRL